MTWVIGASTPFGYGFAISDIRVKLPNGDTYDILQKIYPVGNYMVAGFSGSVRIGFDLIDSLFDFLRLPPKAESAMWPPVWVAENWSQKARKIFLKSGAKEQSLGSQILLVGVSPEKDIDDASAPAQIIRIILTAPHFTPSIYKKTNDISSIGSGSGVSEYIKSLKHYLSFHKNSFLKFENHHTGWGSSIAVTLSNTIRDNPAKGISEHLHIGLVTRGSIEIRKNDHVSQRVGSCGVEEIVVIKVPLPLSSQDAKPTRIDHPSVKYFRMPRTAKSWQDFNDMLKSKSQKVVGAIC